MKTKNLILILFSTVLIIFGILFPFLINNGDLSLIVNMPSMMIVGGVIICYYSISWVYNKDIEKLKYAIDKDVFYNASLVGLSLGAIIGFTHFILNIHDRSAIGPGISTFFISIFYGLLSGQISKSMKSYRELRTLGKLHFRIGYITIPIMAFISVILFTILGMVWSRYDFEKVFYIEDLIAYISMFIGFLLLSKRYIIIYNCMAKEYSESEIDNIKVYLNETIVSAISIAVIISIFRFIIYMLTITALDPVNVIFAMLLFPLIYGFIAGFGIIMPLKYRIKVDSNS